MEKISDHELLNYALKNGILDMALVQEQANMQKRKDILEKHAYNIWQGSDGFWRTYIPTSSGSSRKLVKKKNKKDLEDTVIGYLESNENDTFKNRYSIWVERQQTCGRSDNTVAKYESDYRRFFEGDQFENFLIQNITEEEISSFIARLLNRKKIPYRALRDMMGYMNGIFDKAIRDRLISENPCKYVDLPVFKKSCKEPMRKTAKERTLSSKEKRSLFQKLENADRDCRSYIASYAVELALYTGMRVGELAGLMWSDIDFANGTITIQRSEKYNRKTHEYYISGTKNNLVRVIPLTEDMRRVLRKAEEEERSRGFLGDFVFCNENGRIHTKMISECVRSKTGTNEFVNEKSIHAIRRTLNSNLRCNGVPTVVTAALLGHTEAVNERNYTYDVSSLAQKCEFIRLAGKIS